MDKRLAWLGVSLNQHLWRYFRHLQDDEIEEAYKGSVKTTMGLLGVNKEVASATMKQLSSIDLEAEAEKINRLRINFVTRADKSYPESLRNLYDKPAVLFFKGDLNESHDVVAMVGSRKSTEYGRTIAREIASSLAEAGITIVSGMARGIDSAAHRGALERGRTVAVFGAGIDNIYPPENRHLAKEIEKSGAIVSEYPPGTPPRAMNFPGRNRIIAGLAKVVLIIEASKRSGALITADFALEQGKDILVVPGSIKSAVSAGCHGLLKDGAGVIESADDVLELLGYEKAEKKEAQEVLSEGETKVLAFVDYYKTHVDTIIRNDGRSEQKVLTDLSMLQAQGLIKKQVGGWYLRVR